MNQLSPQPRQVIRPKTVMRRAGISPATFWRRVKNDPTFPKIFPLGEASRAVGVFEDEFEKWLNHCANNQTKK